MKKVPITQKSVTINARVQETGGPMGGAQLAQSVAAELRDKRDDYQQQAIENAYLKGQTVLSRKMSEIEEQYQSDPDGLAEALEEYSTSFLDEVSDPNMSARFQLQIEKASQSAISRATAKRKTIINEQARFDNLTAFEAIKARLPSISAGLLDPDDAIALSAGQELQEVLARAQGIFGATDADGVPLFNAQFRVNQLTDARDVALGSAAQAWFDAQPDKVQALKDFEEGSLNIALPNADGGFDQINVRDSVSPQTARMFQTAAKAEIAQIKALNKQQQDLVASRLELAIETADLPPAPEEIGPQPTVTQRLNNVMQQIDNNPIFNSTPDGQIKGNQLRKKVFAKLDTEREKFESISNGSNYAGGRAFLNPQDTDAVKAYDDYYESIEPGLAGLQPFERNMADTAIVDNAKRWPSRLLGNIQRVARSNDVDQIAATVDLINRVGIKNPHLLQDIPEKDLARLRMIDDRVNQGYTEEDAVKAVDQQLDPRNQITKGEAEAELKDKNINYRAQAVQVFDSAGIFKEIISFGQADGLSPNDPVQKPIIDGLVGAYRTRFEDHYRITRDEKLSKEYAATYVQGLYGVTEVNGTKQIMPYTPEKYYSIEGESNDWMREQMLDAAQDAAKNWLRAPGKYDRRDFKKNLVLLPYPGITEYTAGEGAPRYRLMYKDDYGALVPVSQVPFYFDPDQRRQQLVKEAEKMQQVRDTESAQVRLLFDEANSLKEKQKYYFSSKREKRIQELDAQLQGFGIEVE
ncbi:MAG: hypothetical protein ACPGQQ_00830 [Candidatus Puniceispirillaceae bacterium]